MRQLNRIETVFFFLGGVMMVAGAGLYVFMICQKIASFIFLLGSVCFALMQIRQRYDGSDTTILRLRRIQLLADSLFIISGVLMIDSCYNILASLFANRIDYIQYVYNKWIVTILVAAIIEIYTVHRLSSELHK